MKLPSGFQVGSPVAGAGMLGVAAEGPDFGSVEAVGAIAVEGFSAVAAGFAAVPEGPLPVDPPPCSGDDEQPVVTARMTSKHQAEWQNEREEPTGIKCLLQEISRMSPRFEASSGERRTSQIGKPPPGTQKGLPSRMAFQGPDVNSATRRLPTPDRRFAVMQALGLVHSAHLCRTQRFA
jgi:hypothetical protein